MSLDDEDSDEEVAKTEQAKENAAKASEEKVAALTKEGLPKEASIASFKCLSSLSRLYDTFAMLDMLEHKTHCSLPSVSKTLLPGLSDAPQRDHFYSASAGVSEQIAASVGGAAVARCCESVGEAIRGVQGRTFDQLTLDEPADATAKAAIRWVV